jgi:hypothetical protein
MNRTGYDFFRLTGGLRLGETHEELRRRIEEIVALEARLSKGDLRKAESEIIRRQLDSLRDVRAR